MVILQVLSGNQNFHSVVSNKLRQPITARYIRFKPLLWNYRIGMRTEIHGCLGTVKILFHSGGGGKLPTSLRLNRNRLIYKYQILKVLKI